MGIVRKLMIAGLAAAAAAGPAVGATPVIVRGSYFSSLDIQNCSGATFACSMVSARTPTDKILKVTQVSCEMETSQPIRKITVSETSAPLGSNTQFIQFLPATSTFINNAYVYAFVQPLEFTVRPGRYVRVIATTPNGTTFTLPGCQITGALTAV